MESSSLESLSFKYCYNVADQVAIDSISIEFNTPNLSSLIFWSYSIFDSDFNFQVKFSFPLKIRHLECINFFSDFNVLKNLETLVCQKIVCPFSLADFEHLKRLELFPRQETELEAIKAITNQKKLLRLPNPEILVWGFKDILVTFKSEQHDVADAFDLDEHFLHQVTKHPDKLVGRIPREFEFNINFWVFTKALKEIPNDFFKKFTNIYRVDTFYEGRRRKLKVSEQEYLLKLITESNPKHVDLMSFNFSEEFYEQLTSIQSIEDLCCKFSNINFELFLKLKFLSSLRVSSDKLPISFIEKLFKLNFFRSLSFRYSSFSIILCNYSSYHLCLSTNRKKEGYHTEIETFFDSLEDLIGELQRLKQENKPYLRGALL